jgi:hypothetical protein
MFRLFGLIFLTITIVSCGTIQNREYGLTEPSRLIVRSESLVGSTIQVGSGSLIYVLEENLTSFQTGVLGVKDRENESLETIVIDVNDGSQLVTIKSDGYKVFEKELYIGKGQTREVRIRK